MLLKRLILPILVLSSKCAFAEALSPSLSLSENGQSYRLELRNSSDTNMECKAVEIKAELGVEGCDEILSTYRTSVVIKQLAPEQVYKNVNFGIDFHKRESRRLGKKLVFCGEPSLTFTCNSL